MPEIYGIEKSKAIVKLALDLIKQAVAAGKDGWQFTDFFGFIGMTPAINDAVKSFPQIKLEIKDWSAEETTEFYNFFSVEFEIPNKKTEAFIEHVLDYGIRTAAHVKEGIALVEEFKALKPPATIPAPATPAP